MHNFDRIIRGKERIRKRERVRKRERKKAIKRGGKYLRLKFQDSLCAAEEHKVYQQSATGSLRGEIAFPFAKRGGRKRNVCFGLNCERKLGRLQKRGCRIFVTLIHSS